MAANENQLAGEVPDDHGWRMALTKTFRDETGPFDATAKLVAREKRLSALYTGARALLDHPEFEEAARALFDSAKAAIGATAGYVALLDETGAENKVLFLDAGGRTCTVDPALPMPIRGLREVAYRTGKPAFENQFSQSDWMRFMPEGHADLENVLFAPIMRDGRAVGLIGLANKAGGFTTEDADTAGAFGDMAAVALINSANLAALKQSEEIKSLVLSSTLERFAYYDRNLELVWANETALASARLGIDQLVGKKCHQIWHGCDHVCLGCPVIRSRDEGTPQVAEVTTSDGGVWLLRSYPVFDAEGNVVGVTEFGSDVTEQKRLEKERVDLEQQLRHAHKMEAVGQLAAGIAHDFNNMLSPILGFAELLKEDLVDSPVHVRHLEQIGNAASRARELVQQLLAFSKKRMLSMKCVDLNLVIQETLPLLRRTIRASIELQMSYAKKGLSVNCDTSAITSVLLNLASNAEAAIESGGVLRIETEAASIGESSMSGSTPSLPPGEYAVLRVIDNGVGMESETVERIFDPFFTTKEKWEGTGLGLASVYGIVSQHSGVIRVDSRVGRGTTFELFFPMEADVKKHATQSQSEVTANDAGCSGVVLVVEDEELVRHMTCETFRRLGYQVLSAANGRDGVDVGRAYEGEIDLLFTDIVMPLLNGRELYDVLKKERPNLKVLYMSGYAGDALSREGVIDSDLNVLYKPFTRKDLAAQLHRLLGE